ncbi:FAD/NAD(P)-binding protein [Luteimonas saliphila]|uniref:FAD/NAD(P)-binding protein n=1 Tax=Luteimonas saliphila TaxID=2804919 RepID=UPI00192D44A0|nr:FAD/NAD(P)-binding protein [Luteimonas saliphila]
MTPAQDPGDASFDAVIVGGGAAGVLVAIRLLMREGGALRIAIVEPDTRLARGAAYSTTQPEHLLNVIASRMSAIAEDPGHFVRFLARNGQGTEAGLADVFAPRRDYARYLRHTLESLPGYDALVHLRERATDIERAEAGHVVHLASGARLRASHVVLALGNAARPLPAYLLHEGARVADSWDYTAVAGIEPGADVCILGSGLSMVDVALTLAHGGHHGRILVLSRHGLAPLPHAGPGAQHEGGIDDLLPLGVLPRWRRLRQRVAAAVAAGEPWQWSFDRLRPHGQALWRSLDDTQRRRFLRHAVRYWDIHRHRIAPQVAATLDGLRERCQLEIVPARLRALTADPVGGSCVHFRPRRTAREHMRHADWIVNATGVETNIDLRPDPLLQALRARGGILPGPQGIGLASSDCGYVIDTRGRPNPHLFVIGALRIGELWESIAIPELREQARQIANAMSGTDPTPPD